MAAAAPRLSNLLGDPSLWDNPVPDYATILITLGSADGTANRTEARNAIVNTAQRSPVVVAIAIEGDRDNIYVAHSPVLYPEDLTSGTAMDNCVVFLLGDEPDSVVPIVMDQDAFGRVTNTRCKTLAVHQGPTGHAAAPPVFVMGPHGAGEADTNVLHARRVMILPFQDAPQAVAGQPSGIYSLIGFHNNVLNPHLTAGDANEVARWEPVRDWYLTVCTNNAGGGTDTASRLVSPANPGQQGLLNTFANRHKNQLLARLGHGGPQLSNAAFAAGVATIRDTMSDNLNAHLQFERDRHTKTFADKHGDTLAEQLLRLCGVVDEAHLPEVHRLLLNCPKNREHAVLNNILTERTRASPISLHENCAPVSTNKLLDDVFRSYQPGGTGTEFGRNLSPFAMICRGHDEAHEALKQAALASKVEGGTSVSLQDVATLTSSDIRFPTYPDIAVEKLYAWTVAIDIFHGVGTAIAVNTRNAVMQTGPYLFQLYRLSPETPSVAMEMVCRVLFEFQQDYMTWVTETCANMAPTVPNYYRIVNAVKTSRASSLSPLPAHWYGLIDAPTREAGRGRPQEPSARQTAGVVTVTNANADSALMRRFRDSSFNSITAMMEGHEVEIPKSGNDPVCLTWALKGQCVSNCKRKNAHKRYTRSVCQKIHTLLDECGVENPQA